MTIITVATASLNLLDGAKLKIYIYAVFKMQSFGMRKQAVNTVTIVL
jgi:hypothetical protein